MPTVFIKNETGTVTAGNTSGINDGASFLLFASEEYCKKNDLVSNIEVVDYVSTGCNPQEMGLGPYYAIIKLLEKTKLNINDIDFFEINEAFAAQILGCEKMLIDHYSLSSDFFDKKCKKIFYFICCVIYCICCVFYMI